MSVTITLLAPDHDFVPLAELQELTGAENIREILIDGTLTGYHVEWDNVALDIETLTAEVQDDLINEFQLQVDTLLGDRTDKKAQKIWRRAERMVKAIRFTVEPEWDRQRKAQHLVQGVMGYYDYGLLYIDGAVYNENGNIEVGLADSLLKYWVQEEEIIESAVALERKKRSIKILKAEQLPYIDHLPVIADESQTRLRPQSEVAARAMALNLIARRAQGESLQWYQEKVAQYDLHDAVTPDEWAFAQDEKPPDYVITKFRQRLESYWLLLWALGFNGELHQPEAACDVQQAHAVLDTRTAAAFLQEARLRTLPEILDAADLYYRYHWAVVDAELYGKRPPRGLNPVVVYARHYALNWLIGYQDQEWDSVATDT